MLSNTWDSTEQKDLGTHIDDLEAFARDAFLLLWLSET